MKKKILFMIINMNIGGTEKALLNLVNEMSPDEYDVTILMLEKKGGFLDSIPEGISIEYVNSKEKIKDLINNPPHLSSLKYFMNGKFISAFCILFLHLISKLIKDRSLYYKYLLRNYRKSNKNYDVAVAFAGPMELITYFILNKVKAKKRFQWIHFDVTKIGFNENFSSKLYNEFDKVFVVSEDARNKLLNIIPTIKDKTEVIRNIVSPSVIRYKTMENKGFSDNFRGIRILTIGRLTPEKGQDLAINALAKLINEGFNVKWYCIGEGTSRDKYEHLIKYYNLNDNFILLGAKSNPYPYLNQCDIYVQPSRYEGYCITLIEARCLKKPIITTDVNGSREQINNGETGLIVPIDEFEIYNAVKKLILDTSITNTFISNLDKENLDSNIELTKFFKAV